MCAGKSTLAHSAADHAALAGCCEVVPRCSTREPRQGDVADGTRSVSWEEFRAGVATGSFALSWERPLADGSKIGYGCLPPSGDAAGILMAGHGIYTNRETVRPPMALEQALVVGVAAPAHVRATRVRLRSPDVIAHGTARTEALLAHDEDEMAENVDMLVRNYGVWEATAVDDFIRALSLVLGAAGYQPHSVT
jgi:ribose 1,5-bisphosphokinase PhnN